MERQFASDKFAEKMLVKALKMYTPSLQERAMAEFLADKCDDLGFTDIRIDEVGNLLATRGTGAPKIMLCGHMDTVPGKIRVRKEGDKLYGRGSSDAKAPLMAMLFAAARVGQGEGTITFVGAVDEEGNATGIKNIAKSGLSADYAVFGEPSGKEKVTIAYKGRLAISLRIGAKDSSHASAPWLSENAIQEAYEFAAAIKSALEEGQGEKTRGTALTATVTEVRGGTSHNVTPKECEITMDIRVPVGTTCSATEQKISNIVKEMSAQRKVEAFYSILDETEAFEAAHNSPLVRAFTIAINDSGGRTRLIRKTGTGDMNVIGNMLKIPVVTYGPGDPHASHTTDEAVSVSEYLESIHVLRRMLSELKRLHDRGQK